MAFDPMRPVLRATSTPRPVDTNASSVALIAWDAGYPVIRPENRFSSDNCLITGAKDLQPISRKALRR